MRPEIAWALGQAAICAEKSGLSWYLTCVTNGKHQRGSLHYIGHAFDMDTGTPLELLDATLMKSSLSSRLTSEFDVIIEVHKDKIHASHIHCEFQPKRPLT